MVAGIGLSARTPESLSSALLLIGAGAGISGMVLRGRWCGPVLLLGVVAAACGWTLARTAEGNASPLERLARSLGADSEAAPLLVIRGILEADPQVLPPERSAFDLPWPASASTRLAVAVESASVHDGEPVNAPGRVAVWVRGMAGEPRAGDRVRITGQFRTVSAPLNPGEPDQRPAARQNGISGRLLVDNPGLVAIEPADGDVGALAYRCLGTLRRGAGATLALSAPASADASGGPSLAEQSRATLGALLLGQEEPEVREVGEAFRRLGLLHALAISGFHLTVVSFAALFLLRVTGDRGMFEPLAVAALVIVYLLIVPAQAPVLRSGIMVLALLAAEACGRRYDPITVLGWTAAGLLIWRPLDAGSMGFQLSFGVTAALLWLGPRVHEAFFGGEVIQGGYERAPSLWKRLWQGWFGGLVSACVLAWAVSAPLIAWHTGAVSTFGWLTSVLVLPLVTAALFAGYAGLVIGLLAPLVPGAGALSVAILDTTGTALTWTVLKLDELPGMVWHIPEVPLAWAVAATIVTVGFFAWGRREPHIGSWWTAAAAALLVWLAATLAWAGRMPAGVMRIDVLAIGEGPAILVRVDEHAVLIDARSNPASSPLAAARRIERAARALGCWRVRTMVVTGADAARLSAGPYLVEPLGLADVLAGPGIVATAAGSPGGAAARWLHAMADAGAGVRPVDEPTSLSLADAVIHLRPSPSGGLVISGEYKGAVWTLDSDSGLLAVHPAEGAVISLATHRPRPGADAAESPWRAGAAAITIGASGAATAGPSD